MPNITIKKYSGTTWEEHYPKTIATQIFKHDNSEAIFDGSSKLKLAYLPTAVVGGLNFEGTISLSSNKDADDLISAGMTAVGDYLIVTAGGDIVADAGTDPKIASLAVQAPGDEGDSTLPVTLEAGDWIVLIGIASQTYTVAIINNTYALAVGASTANASASGIISAADISKLFNIEANADVTDASNVTAAGALMDSELASIADVKALNQSVISGASPTFSTANMTDASNKRFMTDAQETKLDSVESNADVTDAANVTSGLVAATSISNSNKIAILNNIGAASTANTADVTLAGSYDYITISNQVITRNQIDYSTDIANKPTASDGLVLDGANFEMVHPVYVENAEGDVTDSTIKTDAILFEF
jgi:hypothetical protein